MFSSSISVAVLMAAGFANAAPSPDHHFAAKEILSRQLCNGTITLNTTVSNYTVQANDTIESIATAVNRGVCDIARANRMVEATLIYPGEDLIIPAQVCDPDNSQSCYLTNNTDATADCVYGGPHTYTTFLGDTLQKIANAKFNISLAALASDSQASDPYAVLEAGQTIKIPSCTNSQCIIQPYRLEYGTVVELAEKYGSTVGQIMAFNSGYNHSDAVTNDTSPVLTVAMNCTAFGTTVAES